MTKTALVTGAEGFIGSNMVQFLHREGWKVVATYLSMGNARMTTGQGVEYAQCDLKNGQRVEQIVSGVEPSHIFHFGAQSLPALSWVDPVETFESNVMGSLYLFEAIRRMKKKPVVVSACSSAEYGHVPPAAIPVREEQPLHPLHPYGISKACLDMLAHQYHLDYDIPATNIRLFNTTGPGKTSDAPSDFVRQLAKIKKGQQEPVIEVGNLKPHRAFLDVSDTVRGFYLAAMKGRRGESYNLCAAKTHEVGELLRRAIRLAGVKVEVRPVERLMRPSDERIIFGDTRKMRRDTGWKPLKTIDETLGAMLEHWLRVF